MATLFEQALLRSAAYNALSLAFLYPEEDTGAALASKMRHVAAGALALPLPTVAVAADAAAASLQGFAPGELSGAFLAIFGHTVPADCPPYEAEYGQAHLFQKSQTLADVTAYYAAFGVQPNALFKDRQDHLSMELAFLELLTFKEAYALRQGHGDAAVDICRKAQRDFLAGHLAAWAGHFARRVERKAGPDNPYLSFARLLNAFLEEECAALQIDPPAETRASVGVGRAAPETLTAGGNTHGVH